MPSISKKLRLARKSAGLTQQDIANRTNLSIEQIQAVESGKLDTIEGRFYQKAIIMKMAKALSLNTHEIGHKFDELTKDQFTTIDLEIARLKNKSFDQQVVTEERHVTEAKPKVATNQGDHKVLNRLEKKNRVDLITIVLSIVAIMIIALLIYTIYTLLATNHDTNSKATIEPKTELISQSLDKANNTKQAPTSNEEQAKQQLATAKEKLGLEYKGEEDDQLVYTMPYKDEYKVAVKAREFAEILDIRDDNGQLYYSDSIDKNQQEDIIIDNDTSYILIYAKPANNLEITVNGVIFPVAANKLSTEYRVYRIDILQDEE